MWLRLGLTILDLPLLFGSFVPPFSFIALFLLLSIDFTQLKERDQLHSLLRVSFVTHYIVLRGGKMEIMTELVVDQQFTTERLVFTLLYPLSLSSTATQLPRFLSLPVLKHGIFPTLILAGKYYMNMLVFWISCLIYEKIK